MRFKTDAERKAMFSKFGSGNPSQSDCDGFANMNGSSSDNRFSYAPIYAAGDIPAMGVDAAGTAGSTVVGAVPLITTLGVVYIGADMALKAKDRLKRQYDAEKHRRKRNRNESLKLKKIFGRWGEQ